MAYEYKQDRRSPHYIQSEIMPGGLCFFKLIWRVCYCIRQERLLYPRKFILKIQKFSFDQIIGDRRNNNSQND